MRNAWRITSRLIALLNNPSFKNGNRHIFAIGGGLAMTTAGITLAYQNLKQKESYSQHGKPNGPLKRLISLRWLEEVHAEEQVSKTLDKPLPSHVYPLMGSSLQIPPAQWDYNWDKRNPESLIKPLKPKATEEEVEDYQNSIKEKTPTVQRTYILVRHGQYEMKDTDEERILTPLGREQANLTGERLASLWKHIEEKHDKGIDLKFTMSTMTRATETAQIILKHFPNTESNSCDLIREGAPCEPVPSVSPGMWDPDPHQFFEEGARIEAGFRRHIHRADASQEKDSVTVVVCHANVIRYFICRALQLPPEAWLRFSLPNASTTTLRVTPTGKVGVSGLGESGHLPPEMRTFN